MLHEDPHAGRGGTERHVRDLQHLQGDRAHVLRPEPTVGPVVAHVSGAGPRHHLVTVPRRRGVRAVWFRPDLVAAIEQVLAAVAPAIVHLHHFAGLGLDWLMKAHERRVPIVCTLHDHALVCPRGQRIRPDLEACAAIDRARCAPCVRPLTKEALLGPGRLPALARLLGPRGGEAWFANVDAQRERLLDTIDRFLAPSEDARDLHVAAGIAPERITVLPHGIDPPASDPTSQGDARRPERTRRPRIGFLGTALCSKGIEVLLHAVAGIEPEDRPELILHGPVPPAPRGPREGLLEAAGVRLAGPYEPGDLPRILGALDAAAFPALWPETFGYALHEVLGAGLPVLASSIGAFEEAGRGSPGRVTLLPAGDVLAWREAIASVVPSRGAEGRHAWSSVAEMGAALDRVYAELSGPQRTASPRLA